MCWSGFGTPCLTVGLTAHVRERQIWKVRVKRDVHQRFGPLGFELEVVFQPIRARLLVPFEACIVESLGERRASSVVKSVTVE